MTLHGVEDSVNGYFSNETPEELSKKIIDICSDTDALKRVGINAGETLYKPWKYAVGNAYKRYKELLGAE